MPIALELLSTVEAFRELAAAELAVIAGRLEVARVPRGAALVRQGEPSTALYLVASGRFHVWRAGEAEPVAEIGPGSPIGEIGFFSGGPRTATVRAERDSLVLCLSRADFDALAAREPRLWSSIVAALASRLARTTAGQRLPRRARPRTVCLLQGAGVADDVVARLVAGLSAAPFMSAAPFGFAEDGSGRTAATGGVLVLDGGSAGPGGDGTADDETATAWFNDVESRHDLVVYLAGRDDGAWAEKAIRQADVVVSLVAAAGSAEPSRPERMAATLHRPRHLWLAVVREGGRPIGGTRALLAARPWAGQHHHLARGSDADIERLVRFLTGRAVGLVASGGGAFCAAHIGVYEALAEAGLAVDAFGGTSGGAAMAAAFALGSSADEIERATADIFVRRRAMWRWTLPRYSLLDHTVLEAALKEHYTDRDIADLPLPFYAVSTNLTRHETMVHRDGPLWQAIRASSAIPALLPPVISGDGDMLVDGCLVDNVPVAPMHELKLGPNVVVDLMVPQADRVERPAGDLPARSELAWRSMTRAGRRALPPGPSPQAVLMRGLMLNASDVRRRLGPEDLLIEVPMPGHASHLDWQRHGELRRLGRDYTRALLERLAAEGHPLLVGAARRPQGEGG